jgi:acetyl esterase
MAAANAPQLWELPVEQARANSTKIRQITVADRMIPGPAGQIPVRVVTPPGAGLQPGLVYFHGGGWVTGSLDSTEPRCRILAEWTPCVVVSVDYRMAPEHKFPAAVDDALAATQWVAAHAAELGIDPARLGVGGDSAGGNLAAVVALEARSRGPQLALQYLCYPVTDLMSDTASRRTYANGYGLTSPSMRWYEEQYLPDAAAAANPLASPLRAPDLKGVPPAIVALPGNDVLHDEGLAYADRLKAAGVPVELHEYPGLIHGFFSMGVESDAAKQAIVDSCRALRQMFAGG